MSFLARKLRGGRVGFDTIGEIDELQGPNNERQPVTRNKDGDDNNEEDYDDENDPDVEWNKLIRSKVFKIANNTLFNWSEFVWKPDHTAFLKGVFNWLYYKENLLFEFKGIRYEPEVRLTLLDEI